MENPFFSTVSKFDLRTAVTSAWPPDSRLKAAIVPTPPLPIRSILDFVIAISAFVGERTTKICEAGLKRILDRLKSQPAEATPGTGRNGRWNREESDSKS
jgi:hypothetical protein